MTDQRWADPAGYADPPPTVAYRILDRESGEVVTRHTEHAYDAGRQRYYLALLFQDQDFAVAIREQIQKACAYFYQKDGYVPLEGWAPSRTTDAEVRARIHRMDYGENSREAERTTQRRYPLEELPWQVQRALIEQIDRIKYEWKFEIVGEVEGVPSVDSGLRDPQPAGDDPTPPRRHDDRRYGDQDDIRWVEISG